MGENRRPVTRRAGEARALLAGLMVLMVIGLCATVALAAYRAHGNDTDVDNFLIAYPEARGGSLDDCYLCHPGGQVDGKPKGSCDYCHASYGLAPPHGALPLNRFAKDYLSAGRSAEAFALLAKLDSDGDSVGNLEEIRQGTNPGEAGDRPGLRQAPSAMLTPERLRAMMATEQFMLMNTTKSGDFYADYRGVTVWDLLQQVGLAPDAKSVSIYSADGFATDFSIDDIRRTCPNGIHYANLPWVSYPADVPFRDPESIPGDLMILLAYEREGQPLDPGRLSRAGSRWVLDGEGPYRVVVPQFAPGPPDRSSTAADRDSRPYPYDEQADHNAGSSVRSVVAIRVNPLPAGTKDFDWREGGWNLVDSGRIVIYGAIK